MSAAVCEGVWVGSGVVVGVRGKRRRAGCSGKPAPKREASQQSQVEREQKPLSWTATPSQLAHVAPLAALCAKTRRTITSTPCTLTIAIYCASSAPCPVDRGLKIVDMVLQHEAGICSFAAQNSASLYRVAIRDTSMAARHFRPHLNPHLRVQQCKPQSPSRANDKSLSACDLALQHNVRQDVEATFATQEPDRSHRSEYHAIPH